MNEWQRIQDLLWRYEQASGQCLNKQKKSIMFSSNISAKARNQIKRTAGVSITSNYEKYPSLPFFVGRSK